MTATPYRYSTEHYAQEYNLVAVEDLNAKRLTDLYDNPRNRAGAARGDVLQLDEPKCEGIGRTSSPLTLRNN
ncbi:Transposase, IS605 OrfB family, central region (plasmid) [Natrarchaeobaculum sulfurireducens]|uniref:Transposase, IS605 OrfB family protein n=1 Tax=Natrarchaeobaculum sulfurireducens TaxID=2044521 RepID=A0A346PKC3_9EURY|nr:transposase, IS605 OrfB family protein [Natrarchaeobaculum sulfurireducens]AXR79968.1 Transposase, IS605 OrfB family, central region [Natrarchaeobaculum sulfurireducens]